MSMFCYQCQETAKGMGCTVKGVCGKNEEVAKLQDLLVYVLKGIANVVIKSDMNVSELKEINRQITESLFVTITNANFDEDSIENYIRKMINYRDELKKKSGMTFEKDSCNFEVNDGNSMLQKASYIGVLSTVNPDIRSLRETIL